MRLLYSSFLAATCAGCLLPAPVAGHPNYLFVAGADYPSTVYRVSLDDPAYPMTVFADVDDGLCNPAAMAWNPAPEDPATDELFVAYGNVGVNIVKFVIDGATGERISHAVFGPQPPLRSIAFQPGTNRLFGGGLHRLYRFAGDGSSYDVVFEDGPRPDDPPNNYILQDECCIAFHPVTGRLYVAAGLQDIIPWFTWNDAESIMEHGDDDIVQSYDGVAWHHPKWPLFVRTATDWELVVAAQHKPSESHSFLRFDPGGDTFLGGHCIDALYFLWNFTKSGGTGAFYSGTSCNPPQLRTAPADYSSVTRLYPAPPLPTDTGLITVLAWPPDLDSDGVPDGVEDTNRNGLVDAGETDPRNPDTDSDGLSDLEELSYGGGPDSYGAGDTDPNKPDSDNDQYSDFLETQLGFDPLDDTRAPSTISINFQASGSTRLSGFARADAGASDARGFGWQP